MDLQKIRDSIDDIDGKILSLLTERMELALRTRRLKATIRDKAREAWVLERAERYSRNHKHLVQGDFVHSLFVEIIEESRRIQAANRPLAGFPGEHGARSELAAQRYDSGLVPIPCGDLEDVLLGVENSWLDFGVVPLENPAGGTVPAVSDLMVERRLSVAGAVKLGNGHSRVAPPDTNPKGGADHDPSSYTRFLVLARDARMVPDDKCAFFLSAANGTGPVPEVLEIFARARLDLTLTDSFPCRSQSKPTVFFLDVQSRDVRDSVEPVLDVVRRKCRSFRFLGFFKEEVYE